MEQGQNREEGQRPRILVADSYVPEALEVLRARAEVDVKRGLDEAGLCTALAEGGYVALLVRSESKVTAKVLAASSTLQVVGRAGVGVDNIDVEAATRHGVLVLNMPTGNTITTAEHTIALLCSLVRHIPQANAALREGRWDRTSFTGTELDGKTLGIVGLGRVGTEVARRAVGLAMKVVAYDPYVTAEAAERLRVTLCSTLDDLLIQSEILTVHTSLGDETRGLIDTRALALMPAGSRVINCARGGIIDEAALLAALESGHLAGAAIDVFVGEPIKDAAHPLIAHPRVVATPHLGASTHEAQLKVAVDTARAVLSALDGEPVPTAVNVALSKSPVAALAPYLDLARTLGQLAVQWDNGPLISLRVSTSGDLADVETGPLASAALTGIFGVATGQRVNMVNARFVAGERGLLVEELRSSAMDESYRGAITVLLQRENNRQVELVGAVVHGQPHLLSINGYRLDLPLAQAEWLVTRHADRPGLIGAVGQILGEAEINIAFMQLGRDEPRGMALMVVGVDSHIPDEVFSRVGALDWVQSSRRVRIG